MSRQSRPLLLLLLAGCTGGEELILPGAGEPATIAVVEGNGQSGRVGETLADPIVVQVTDSRGRPVRDAPVGFEFSSGGAGADVVPDNTTTNSDGLADARIVLGTSVGQQTGQARVVTGEGGREVETSFSATAFSEDANSMAAVAGEDQTGHVGMPLDDQLVVEVTDGFGNPVAGVAISWAAEGGGSVSAAVVETGEDGRARVDRILGPAVGLQTTLATSEGLAGSPVTFVHTALAGDASRLVIISGDDQTAAAGSVLPAELVVRLVDAEGNGVPRTAVSWVVATGGGSPSPEFSTTDDDGRASSQWTLGGPLGEQRLDAVVSGVGFISFTATATAGAPASLFISTQPSPSARNGIRFEQQPVIQVRDARGNDVALAGVPVSVAIEGAGGGELLGTRLQNTDAAGRATFTDLAISGAPGVRTLIFEAPDYASAASAEINLEALPTVTTITGDAPDPSAPGAPFTVSVRVTSAGPTPTGTVTVVAGGGGPSCTATLVAGSGNCSLALNTSGTLTATYPGGPGLLASSDTEGHNVTVSPPPNQAPDADYNWHCEGLTCEFTDATTDRDGRVTAWTWNFGGTGSSNAQNPTHTFPGTGEYQVTLTVTDNGGATDVSSAGVDVEAPPANRPPTAAFTWDCDDLECDFEDESSDGDGRIETRSWTFGDGDGSNDRDPSHEYDAGGTYPVRLRVTDNDGASHTIEHAVTVQAANQRPTADFTWTCSHLNCQFTGTGSDPDGSIATWSWDFDDGESSNAQSPSHTFDGGGTYEVRLTVTDNAGATRAVEHDVNVTAPPPPNRPPSAAFTRDCDDLECDFEDESSDPDGSIESWAWTFGDGGASNDRNPSHEYSGSGTYTVRLTVTDDDGAPNSVEHAVTVEAANQNPTADFSWTCNGLSCQFTGTGSDPDGSIATWSWNFDDGGSSGLQSPEHTFPNGGTYEVRLTVTDNDGGSETIEHDVTVVAPPPPNQPPVAANDGPYETPGGGLPLTVDAPGVLANDTDAENSLTAENASDPALGTVVLSQDGSFTYTPDPGASGPDTFTYDASDGFLTSQATVTITINP